jgi:hypothetical protein
MILLGCAGWLWNYSFLTIMVIALLLAKGLALLE